MASAPVIRGVCIRGGRYRLNVPATAGIVAATVAVLTAGFALGASAAVSRPGAIATSVLDPIGRIRLVTSPNGYARGYVLFAFSADTRKSSRCTGRCSRTWIPFITRGTPRVAAGSHLRKRLLGTIRRPDGQLQVTYNHHPLYRPPHDRDPCFGQLDQFGGKFAYIAVSGRLSFPYCGPY